MEIRLLEMKKEHLPFLLEVRNDKTTRSMLENDSVFTLEQCEAWFETLKNKWYIIQNSNGEFVGYLRVNDKQLGCDIHPKFRRQGYARAAYLEYLKDKTYSELWVFDDNFAKDLYLSLGYKETGNIKFIRDRKYAEMIWKS